jgi:hypothetical protein
MLIRNVFKETDEIGRLNPHSVSVFMSALRMHCADIYICSLCMHCADRHRKWCHSGVDVGSIITNKVYHTCDRDKRIQKARVHIRHRFWKEFCLLRRHT